MFASKNSTTRLYCVSVKPFATVQNNASALIGRNSGGHRTECLTLPAAESDTKERLVIGKHDADKKVPQNSGDRPFEVIVQGRVGETVDCFREGVGEKKTHGDGGSGAWWI